jgi:hypothetical protein
MPVQHFFSGEKALTARAHMRAFLPVQCDLVSVAVMLPREHFPAAHCAGK